VLQSSFELKSSGGKPRVLFYLKPKERKEVLIWLQNLKFPVGYAADFCEFGLRKTKWSEKS
jgi:hypothetical protein